MALRKTLVLITIMAVLFPSLLLAGTNAPDAEKQFAEGNALLHKGDFKAAFNAYSAASKADPENTEYAQQAMMIRRVLMIRQTLEKTEFSPQWEKMMLSLHAFYMTYNLHEEALALNKEAHAKMNNATSASLLAETLLAMNKNSEALELLKGLDEEKLNQQNRLYLGITLARLNRMEEAGRIRDELSATEASDIGFLFDMARIQTLLGNTAGAHTLLTNCFEKTPPSQLDQIKTFVKNCQDFKPLMSSAGFDGVMQTASKVVESGCSGGASCGSCPSRNQCSSQGAAKAAPAESSCGDCDSKSDEKCKGCEKK